jgi:hypothetical protein
MNPKELKKLPHETVVSWYRVGIITKKEFKAYQKEKKQCQK